MSKSSKNHIFNAIGREFEDEFTDLKLIFLPCLPGEQEYALESKRLEIRTHDAGAAITAQINADQRNENSFPYYYAESRSKRLMGLIKSHQFLAVILVDLSMLSLFEDENFAIKFCAYRAAFPAIHAHLKNIKKIGTPSLPITAPDAKTQKEIEAKNEPDPKIIKIREKLMADAFAAMRLESIGEKGAVQQIIKRLCGLATEKATASHPEHHPLPLAMDALNVVYRDLKDNIPPKSGKLEHTHFMATEIGMTYDDNNIAQWPKFSYAAQDMAWADFKVNQILSAAIYGSDNPYIRSIAHICAESLNTAPVPLKSTDIYNPFSDHKTGERAHVRLGRVKFFEIMEKINDGEDPHIFLDIARKQTRALLQNKPLGWAAPALIEAENACRLFQENPLAEVDMIVNAFEDMFTKIRWNDLRKLNRKITMWRQKNQDITPNTAAQIMDNILGDDEIYKPYREAFHTLAKQASQ